MTPTRIVVKDTGLKNYIFRKYMSAEIILKDFGVDILEHHKGNTRGKVSGFPRKYLHIFNEVLKKSVKIIVFNKHILFEVDSINIYRFFTGQSPNAEKVKFVERGSRPSGKYFFFNIKMQKRYADILKTPSSTSGITYSHDKSGRRTKIRKKRTLTSKIRRKQFEIRKGNEGAGITAIWENFSKRGQGILKRIYGCKPYWPGFHGLNIRTKVIEYYFGTKLISIINNDKTVLEYLDTLYGFDLSKANIIFDELLMGEGKTVASGSAQIKQDKRKLEATHKGPLGRFYAVIAKAISDLFK